MDATVNKVNCYSGHRYAQRPYSFYWQDVKYEISAIIKEENTPQGKRFLVQVSDGMLFYLYYYIDPDSWRVSRAYLPENPRRNL
jgi:hypothetical protein